MYTTKIIVYEVKIMKKIFIRVNINGKKYILSIKFLKRLGNILSELFRLPLRNYGIKLGVRPTPILLSRISH